MGLGGLKPDIPDNGIWRLGLAWLQKKSVKMERAAACPPPPQEHWQQNRQKTSHNDNTKNILEQFATDLIAPCKQS